MVRHRGRTGVGVLQVTGLQATAPLMVSGDSGVWESVLRRDGPPWEGLSSYLLMILLRHPHAAAWGYQIGVHLPWEPAQLTTVPGHIVMFQICQMITNIRDRKIRTTRDV